MLLLPCFQAGQELLQRFLVANQVVVDEIDMPPVAQGIKPV
jgi:hypothetical protein